MTCELSPLVYAELYRILSERHANDLSERLHEIDLDDAWLDEASEAYRRKWEHERETSGLRSDHALLGSWLLAGIRDRASSDELTVDLRFALVEQLAESRERIVRPDAPAIGIKRVTHRKRMNAPIPDACAVRTAGTVRMAKGISALPIARLKQDVDNGKR